MLLYVAHAILMLRVLTVNLVKYGEGVLFNVAHASIIFNVLTVQIGEIWR